MITAEEISTPLPDKSSESVPVEFDDYASSYEVALQTGLQASGEHPSYFARRRIEWTHSLLECNKTEINTVLDFGCGVGLAAPILNEVLSPKCIWGFDPSRAAIDRARRDHSNSIYKFTSQADEIPKAECDLVYTNGVFHHIPRNEREVAFESAWMSLKPGGWFAFWENNPWNPGTRLVMSHIPFDRDAVTISPYEANRLLRYSGFNPVRTDAWFLFPHFLRALRPLEWLVHRLPLGAQYLVLAQKPLPSQGH